MASPLNHHHLRTPPQSVSSFPEEVLHNIFERGCEVDIDFNGPSPTKCKANILKPFAKLLSHVCALWRMLIIQDRHYRMTVAKLSFNHERVESLEDDIQEMKHIFHTQLSNLVDELNHIRSQSWHAHAIVLFKIRCLAVLACQERYIIVEHVKAAKFVMQTDVFAETSRYDSIYNCNNCARVTKYLLHCIQSYL